MKAIEAHCRVLPLILPRSLEIQRNIKGLKGAIGAIGAIEVLLSKNREGGYFLATTKTPLNKKGEELPIAPISPIASTQIHIPQGNQEAIAAQ